MPHEINEKEQSSHEAKGILRNTRAARCLMQKVVYALKARVNT